MVPQVRGRGQQREDVAQWWVTRSGQEGRKFEFQSEGGWRGVGRGGARKKNEGLRSRLTSGLWHVKDAPSPKNKILSSFHGRLGAGRDQDIITNSQLCFMGY